MPESESERSAARVDPILHRKLGILRLVPLDSLHLPVCTASVNNPRSLIISHVLRPRQDSIPHTLSSSKHARVLSWGLLD
ncbi:hypothetical protein ACFX1T_028898 [Malus domestica]